MHATVEGTLQGSHGSRQFPCVWLHEAAGADIEVAWLNGWTTEDSPTALITDDAGQTVAMEGDVVTVEGVQAQIGSGSCGFPAVPFNASSVVVHRHGTQVYPAPS